MQRIKDAMVALDFIENRINLSERFSDLYRSSNESKINLETFQKLIMENPKDEENKTALDNATRAFSDVSKAINLVNALDTSHKRRVETIPDYDKKMKTLEEIRTLALRTIEEFNKDIRVLIEEKGKKTTDANIQSIIQNEIFRLKDMNKMMGVIDSAITDVEEIAADDLKSQDKMEKNYQLFMKREENTEKGKPNLALMTKKIAKELTQVFSQTPLPPYITQDDLMRAAEKGNIPKEISQNSNLMNRLIYGNGDDKSLKKGREFVGKICGVDMKNGGNTKEPSLHEGSSLYKALQPYATPVLFEQNFAILKASEQKSGFLKTITNALRSPAESATPHASQNTSMQKMLFAGVVGQASSGEKPTEGKSSKVTFAEPAQHSVGPGLTHHEVAGVSTSPPDSEGPSTPRPGGMIVRRGG